MLRGSKNRRINPEATNSARKIGPSATSSPVGLFTATAHPHGTLIASRGDYLGRSAEEAVRNRKLTDGSGLMPPLIRPD